MKLSLIVILTAIFLLSMINGCKHEIYLPADGSADTTVVVENCSPDTVYFSNQVFPLINSTCAKAGCHDAISHEEGLNLTSYTNIMKYIVPFNPSRSKLFTVLTKSGEERMPQPPNAPWTSQQIALFRTWINQGALNNGCNSCDTADFKYSTAIQPIIQNNCVGCHSGSSASGNINLSTYAGVKAVVVNGKLFGSISWAAGYSAMPKGAKLTDCKIKQVKKWIDAGSPNN